MYVVFGAVELGSIGMSPEEALEAAWLKFETRLPDRSDLTPYQIARTRSIFEAGWRSCVSLTSPIAFSNSLDSRSSADSILNTSDPVNR